jgi:hypothetical protein
VVSRVLGCLIGFKGDIVFLKDLSQRVVETFHLLRQEVCFNMTPDPVCYAGYTQVTVSMTGSVRFGLVCLAADCQSVLVSGSLLEPMTRFYLYPFFRDNYFDERTGL